MNGKPKESDWKLYSSRVAEWRDRHLKRKNKEIVAVLTDTGRTPTDQFWDAKEMMRREAKILTDCLDGNTRSRMAGNLLLLRRHKLIQDADLEGFSEALRERTLALFKEIGP